MRTIKLMTAGGFLAAMIFAAPTLDAKPGKGNGGGKPSHAEKGGKGSKGKANKGNGKKDHGPSGQPSGKVLDKAAKDWEKAAKKNYSREELAGWRFRELEQNKVRGYFGDYKDREHGLPPGLAKNLRRGKPLPPGWQKKLNRGYVMDDIWWNALTPVSYDYFPDFERYPDTGLYLYGDRVIRVYEPRREVIDVVVVPTINIRLP